MYFCGWNCQSYLPAGPEYIDCVSAEGCPGYYTQQSDGEASIILELLGMRNTPLLPSLPGLLCPGMVAPDRVLFLGQIELNSVKKVKLVTIVGSDLKAPFSIATTPM